MNKNFANVEIGSVVSALGIKVTIEKILYSEYWDRYGYDIEFTDTKGKYHHWKQDLDGGELIAPKKEKRYINYYGSDCTDIFKKYGY